MEQEVTTDETEENSKHVSIGVLSKETRALLSNLLNPKKIIPNDNGLLRDWRGLFELCDIPAEQIPSLERIVNPCDKILDVWLAKSKDESTIDRLLSYMEQLDRFDIIDDITPLIERDIAYYKKFPKGYVVEPPVIDDKDVLTNDDVTRKKQGLPPQTYDAFVLFAEDDIDFAVLLVETMERQYNLKLCVKNRDLVAGAMEHDSVIQLIANRCSRLIVIVSPAFLESSANDKFLCSFAQVQGIEQGARKIIPCLYKDCKVPPNLSVYFLLDYVRSGKFCNFWDRLCVAIVDPGTPATADSHLNINKSMETLKTSNHVKFNSLADLAASEDAEGEEKAAPMSSFDSLEPYTDGKGPRRKKESFYKRLIKIVQPKGVQQPDLPKVETGLKAEEEVKPQLPPQANGVRKEKKKFWKSNKMKVPVVN